MFYKSDDVTGTKNDKTPAKPDYTYTPEQYSQMAGLPPPLLFTAMPDRETAQQKAFQTCVLFASFPLVFSKLHQVNTNLLKN